MFNSLKYAYQRLTRGYDETIYWGFDEYLEMILPPLRSFCLKRLDDGGVILSYKRREIYRPTVLLIDKFNETYDDFNSLTEIYEAEDEMCSYIGIHLGWYWD